MGVRTKTFLAVFVIILIVIEVTGLILSHFLTDNLSIRIENELSRHAASVRTTIEIAPDISNTAVTDSLADRMGEDISARVTIIAEDGRVIGDSELNVDEIHKIENHGNRPEIQVALSTGNSVSRRFSTTLNHDELYIAQKFNHPDRSGVVRVSRPLFEIDEALSALGRLLAISGLIGLAIAFLVSAISSHFLSKTLGDLVSFAKKVASGEKLDPIKVVSSTAFGGLAGSLNKLSEQLEDHVTGLARQRDQFEAVLDGMSEAVIALDENEKVTMLNRAGIMLLGLSGQPIGQMLLEAIRSPALQELVSNVNSSAQQTIEFSLPGEQTRIILARATRPKTGGAVIVLLDVTELRRLENLRRDFVSNVSHELRTPVSIIRANSETLLDGAIEDKEAAERFLNSMLTNSERLTNLISDLLDISRIEEGEYKLSIETIPLALALRRAAAGLETQAIDRNFSIRVEPSQKLQVAADEKALDQVLFNILDNAVKYVGRDGSVTMRAIEENKHIRIEIEDNGPGISKEDRARLFERFYRVDPGRSREMGGTGLGLAIVKHLVLAMNGEVGMTPASPNGSVFWITLPVPGL